ncbi:hypothetical protein QAD02_003402 [Eretmocerus hayati]|uniref:Uncharacterized protein n=1 Tax=Eretmocerus hayati TaxID=131215 RepID=A0ACC2NLR9_9HYME|nr:hypothetical protein QAD02_003402 [Eretmocerus hayati]
MNANILELDDERLVREMEREIEESSESSSQLRICELSETVNNEERQLDAQDVSSAPPPHDAPRPASEDGYITRSSTMSPDNEEYKLIRRARKRPRSSSFTSSPVKEECELIRRAQKRPRQEAVVVIVAVVGMVCVISVVEKDWTLQKRDMQHRKKSPIGNEEEERINRSFSGPPKTRRRLVHTFILTHS